MSDLLIGLLSGNGGGGGGDSLFELDGTDIKPKEDWQNIALAEDRKYKIQTEVIQVEQNSIPDTDSTSDAWQSFSTGGTKYINAVEWNCASLPSTNLVNLNIYDGEGTGGTLLYTANNLSITATGWIKFDLTIPILVSGTHTMRLTSGASFDWGIAKTNVYANGRYSASATWDAGFKIYTVFPFTQYAIDNITTSQLFSFYSGIGSLTLEKIFDVTADTFQLYKKLQGARQNIIFKSGSFRLFSSQIGYLFVVNSISAVTLTVPETSTEDIDVGANWDIYNVGGGDITIVKEGTDILTGNTLVQSLAGCQIEKRIEGSPNTYDVFGGTSLYLFTIEKVFETTTAGRMVLSYPLFSGTVINATGITKSGTVSLAFDINVTPMTHAALNVSSVKTTVSVTANNTFVSGDEIAMTPSGISAPFQMLVSLECVGRI